MKYNLNNAKKQGERTIVPAGAYRLSTRVRPGGCGEEGDLRLAKNMSSLLLELKLTVASGEYEGASFLHFMTVAVDGGEEPTFKQRDAIEWGLSTLRSILESAYKIHPDDESDEAQKRRQFNSFSEFDYLEFVGRVGMEKTEQYGEQNKLLRVIRPGDKDWPEDEAPPPQAPPSPVDDIGDSIPF
jgi:hypothetical protein